MVLTRKSLTFITVENPRRGRAVLIASWEKKFFFLFRSSSSQYVSKMLNINVVEAYNSI